MEAIVAACGAVLLGAMLKLMRDFSEFRGEMRTMKEYWTRTAERRDALVHEITRLQAAERRRLENAEHGRGSGG